MTIATQFNRECNNRLQSGITYTNANGLTIDLDHVGGYLPIGNGVISRIIVKRAFPASQPVVWDTFNSTRHWHVGRPVQPWTNLVDAKRNRILRNVYHVGDNYNPSASDEYDGYWLPTIQTGHTRPNSARNMYPTPEAYANHVKRIKLLNALRSIRRDLRYSSANA